MKTCCMPVKRYSLFILKHYIILWIKKVLKLFMQIHMLSDHIKYPHICFWCNENYLRYKDNISCQSLFYQGIVSSLTYCVSKQNLTFWFINWHRNFSLFSCTHYSWGKVVTWQILLYTGSDEGNVARLFITATVSTWLKMQHCVMTKTVFNPTTHSWTLY